MGNCGSFPKTKGDEAEALAPVLPKEESLKINNVEETVKVKEDEKKTITTDDHVHVNDVEKKDSDDHGETKPGDDNNPHKLEKRVEFEQEQLLEKLEVFKIKGKDKQGRKILRIIRKFFPARILSIEVLRKYLEENIFPRLGRKKFYVLYVHSGVQRSENFPGISALRSIFEAIPINVKENLEAVYFVHPGLQSRLFLATFGRLLFSGG
ncbi:CRAL-TRIO lipid binding domain containing protein [Trema orientale]|uniref:CRAL-TRIO lipid binding domain containing protein n=1 Tax=Trema orientale TaxID=63057 RepID=A0A2P5EQD2_TREOI|nr:CRAL-TRIO lipid binding domain containing protein [Trema orientale]